MRAARIEDHRRHLREKRSRWKLRLERFSFEGIPSLGREELAFSSALTVICGPNGVGKTTLLRAIRATVDPTSAQGDTISVHKLPSGTATLGFHFEGVLTESIVTFTAGLPTGGTTVDIEVVHLDVSSALPAQQALMCSFESASDLTNGTGAKVLERKEIDTLNYLAKRDYKDVVLYEVDGEDQSIVPYFEIKLDDSSYDSRTMGAGEFAIFYLWWALTRVSENALVLIEEPECHLSPGSQAALCDFLLRMTDEKTLTIIMTTHSSKIVSKLDDDNLIFLYRDGKGVQIVRGKPSPALLETLGVETIVDTIIFVEDQAAVQFGRFLLDTFRPDLARRTEFVDRGGEGNITVSVRAFAGIANVAMIGLYDGDVRGKVPEDAVTKPVFLPGDEPVERALRKLLEANTAQIKVALGRPDLGEILFGLKGGDPHEWYAGLCRSLGQSAEQLFPTLFRIWLREGDNESLARAVVENLADLYKTRR